MKRPAIIFGLVTLSVLLGLAPVLADDNAAATATDETATSGAETAADDELDSVTELLIDEFDKVADDLVEEMAADDELAAVNDQILAEQASLPGPPGRRQASPEVRERLKKLNERRVDLQRRAKLQAAHRKIAVLEAAVAANPDNGKLLTELAHMYRITRQFGKAIITAEKALRIDPTNQRALIILAQALRERGDVDRALNLLAGRELDNPAGRAFRAILRAGQGDVMGGVHDVEEAIKRENNRRTLYATLKKLHAQRQDGDRDELKVYVRGRQPNFDLAKPVIKEGRTLVPVRAIVEALAAHVDWNQDTRTVIITKGDKTINLVISDVTATINGRPVSLDVPADIVNGRTVVPLRFVSEYLDSSVEWDAESRMIIVEEDQAQLPGSEVTAPATETTADTPPATD